jgi:hypothetical protein
MRIALLLVVLGATKVSAQDSADAVPVQTKPEHALARGQISADYQVVKFDVSPPLRLLPTMMPGQDPSLEGGLIPDESPGAIYINRPGDVDAVAQTSIPQSDAFTAPIVSFNAMTNINGVAPPDPAGDIGPQHYVAMSNLSFQIFNRAGTSLFGPVANNTLWAGFGGACQTENAGDPVVLYDQFADRWLLTQFTSAGPTFFNCVAISTTGDPTGSYFRYAISTGGNFPDYPKFGVFGDSYLISTREFLSGAYVAVGAYALRRSDLIAGNPNPALVKFVVQRGSTPRLLGDGLLPVDVDGSALPPAGSPAYFVGSQDDGGPYSATSDALLLWKLVIDYVTPANSSFTLTDTIPIASFDTIFPCTGRQCIPQLGTTVRLDILSYRQRPLHRLAYRNFGTHESLVTNQSVEGPNAIAGIRWWEIRSPNSNPVIFQEGTFVPGATDGIHRWMASAAMDRQGNLAIGYSASSATMFPDIRYSGRLVSDPLGQLPQGEGIIVNGGGAQTAGGNRWGDYTSLNIDPLDDCTFWHVNEYLPSTSTNGWRLRVGAFKFDQCRSASISLAASNASALSVCADAAPVLRNLELVRNSTSEAVTLTASQNPVGSTVGFAPNPIPAAQSASVLSLSANNSVAAGTYNVRVTASASGLEPSTIDLPFRVFVGNPSPPTPNSPANGATAQAERPTLSFAATSANNIAAFRVELARDAAFTQLVFASSINTTSVAVPIDLASSTQYFWRVRADNGCGQSSFSPTFSFTTGAFDRFLRNGFEALPVQ